ncbi:MAG: carbohydrate binding family 9 domain-containing protein [Archangiaceae bacterium]|nr:carbohydrate binding family 9 domain-containing protein [Archangiaceae bacterium]
MGRLFVTLLLSSAAAASTQHAVRTEQPVTIEGSLDEPAWQDAPEFTDFTENWPNQGATPSQRTSVRVLYDDRTLYVGIICFDSEPEKIMRTLGRRDSVPTADMIELAIDSALTRRSAYYFNVNAAGVQRDGLLFNDVRFSETWDAVWASGVATRPDGWSVELAIPLSVLRFPKAQEQRWGFLVRRTVPRTHQTFDSTLIPRTVNAGVSRFGELAGLVELKPKRGLEIVPYAAARLSVRPQFSAATTPHPRLVDPALDLGADLRTALLSDLTLNATVNPDFGQVEADQLILNLSNSELFFPEKRPFFNQGLDIFEPVGSEYGAPHQLFYSRRIGLDTPIFAAAKVTGTVAPGLSIGVLDAVVLGPADPGKASIAFRSPSGEQIADAESRPDGRVGLHLERPLHLGLDRELPAERPTPKNFLAAVARYDATRKLNLGVTFTAATPLAPRCTPADFATSADYLAGDCQALGGETLGLDWDLRSENRDWVFLGLIDGSHRVGGPKDDTLRDGTVMHPGDLGFGGYFKAGKFGGEGFRGRIEGAWTSPRLDLNATGFMSSQNQARLGVLAQYVRTQGLTLLRDFYTQLNATTFWTTDGRFTPRGTYLGWELDFTFNTFDNVGLGVNVEIPFYDVREIDGAGVPFERQNDVVAYFFLTTDSNRALSLHLQPYVYRTFGGGPARDAIGYGGDASAVLRPHPRFETQLALHGSHDPYGARWVDTLDDASTFIFGDQQSENMSVTLRQTVALAAARTLQGYAQLFSAYAHYPRYFAAGPDAKNHIDVRALTAFDPSSSYDFHDAALNLNVVMRWQYRPGSTLFFVYTRSQRELGYFDGQPSTTALFPLRLGPGPITDTVLLKWTYWFSA